MMISCRQRWLIFFLLASNIVLAQEDIGLFRLDEGNLSRDSLAGDHKIVSASKSLKEADDIPMSVFIVTREEILENGYITLVDALKSVPGIKVSQPGSAVEGETFLLRGLHGNYFCKILIDGVPVQPSVVGGMPISAQLPIRQADRIEVTFGPSSSIFGADALAGVINIVTHSSDRPVTAQADISLGGDAREYLNVTIGGKAGKNRNVLTYSMFGSGMSRRDMNVKDDVQGVYDPSIYDSSYSFVSAPYYQGDSTTPTLGNLPESSRMIGFSLKWRGLAFQFLTMSRKTHSSIGLATDVYSYASTANFWGETIQRYTLSYDHAGTRLASSTVLSLLHYRLDNESSFGMIYPVGNTGNAYKYAASDDLFLEEQLTWVPLAGLECTGGVSLTASGNLPRTNDLAAPFDVTAYHAFSTDPVSDSTFGDFGYNPVTFYNAGGYLQVYYTKGRFVALLADRYDYHSRYGGSNNPKLSLQYRLSEGLTLRGNVGTGFRAPSAHYAYASLASARPEGILYTTVPNVDLKPERLLAAEAGLNWKPSPRINIDATLFYHRLVNQFSRSFVPLDTTLYPHAVNEILLTQAYVNDDTSRASLVGLQCYLQMKDLIEAVHLTMEVQFTLSKGMESLPNGLGRIESYRQWPAAFGQVNLSIRPARYFYLYFRNTLSSGWTREYFPVSKDILDLVGYDTRTRGYYTLDIVGRVSLNRNFQAFFQLNNVFDARYAGSDAYGTEADLRYNPQYGRNFRIGLSFRME